MEKQDEILAGKHYLISHSGNNKELLFPAPENANYFVMLMNRHLLKIGVIRTHAIDSRTVRIIFTVNEISDLPEQYRERLYQPFSNLFNAYTKAFNKYIGRSGNLFNRTFERKILWTEEQLHREMVKIENEIG